MSGPPAERGECVIPRGRWGRRRTRQLRRRGVRRCLSPRKVFHFETFQSWGIQKVCHCVASGPVGGWFAGVTTTLTGCAEGVSAIAAAGHGASRPVGRWFDSGRVGILYSMVLGCLEAWQGASVTKSGLSNLAALIQWMHRGSSAGIREGQNRGGECGVPLGRMGKNLSRPFPYFPSFSQIQVPSYLRNPPKGRNSCHLFHFVPFCPIRSLCPVCG